MKKIYEKIIARARQMTDEQFRAELQSYKDDAIAVALREMSEIGGFAQADTEDFKLGSSELVKFFSSKEKKFLSVKDRDFKFYPYDVIKASNDSSYALAA